MAIILVSKCCMAGFRHQGGEWPTVCPQCKKPCDEWTGASIDEPRVPYLLTGKDWVFLKVLHIDPECERPVWV